MTPDLAPGDIILTGINAQGFISRVIKLGSILRYGPRWISIVAFFLFYVPWVAAVVVAALYLTFFGFLLLALVGGFVVGTLLAAGWTMVVSGKAKNPAVQFSHSFLVLSVAGRTMIQEAQSRGVVRTHMHYQAGDYAIVKTSTLASYGDLAQVNKFSDSVLAAKIKYGKLTFLGLLFYCISAPWPFFPTFNIQQSGTAICSGYCCDAGTRWGAMPSGAWKREPYVMMPCDIYDQAITEGVPVIYT
jgi:hypothetical protein